METTLEGLIDVCCIVYIDDILIYSDAPKEHAEHLRQVLEHLRNAKLFVKRSKYCFYEEDVQFLGFYVSAEGIAMENSKVQAINDWPMPKSINEIQIFLGFANFYRRFIQGFSKIAGALTEHLKKSTVKEVVFSFLLV